MPTLDKYSEKIKQLFFRNTGGYDVIDFRIGTAIGTLILLAIPLLNITFNNIIPDNFIVRNTLISVQILTVLASYQVQFVQRWANEIGNLFSLIYSMIASTLAYQLNFDLTASAFALISIFTLMGMFKDKKMMTLYTLLSTFYMLILIAIADSNNDNKYFLLVSSFPLFLLGYYMFSLKLDAVDGLKARELELIQKEVWFRSIFENVPTGIILYDEDNRPFKCNKYLKEILGYSEEELCSADMYQLIQDTDDEPYRNNTIHESSPVIYEQKIRNRYGQVLWVRVKMAPMFIDNKKYTIGMLNDITIEKQNDIQLREFTQQLKVHNQALEEFSYVISHDLQEPLRMITSFTQIIKRRYLPQINDIQADKDFNYVIDGAKRMSALIRDMLEYSRWSTKSLPAEIVNIKEVLDDVLQNLAIIIEDSHAQIETSPFPIIITNRLMLGQVFQNLIGNAIKYSHPMRSPYLEIKVIRRERDYLFSIKDNGIGFEPQYSNRIFGIFQRLNASQYEGNGMGLAICKRIVEKQGGIIWAESESNEGACFYFTLPYHEINLQNEDLHYEHSLQKYFAETSSLS